MKPEDSKLFEFPITTIASGVALGITAAAVGYFVLAFLWGIASGYVAT